MSEGMGTEDDVKAVGAFKASVDAFGDETPADFNNRMLALVEQLRSKRLHPTIVISAGVTAAFIWGLRTPFRVKRRRDRKRAKDLLLALNHLVEGDGVTDLRGLVPLAGTVFHSGGRQFRVEFIHQDPSQTYLIGEIERRVA